MLDRASLAFLAQRRFSLLCGFQPHASPSNAAAASSFPNSPSRRSRPKPRRHRPQRRRQIDVAARAGRTSAAGARRAFADAGRRRWSRRADAFHRPRGRDERAPSRSPRICPFTPLCSIRGAGARAPGAALEAFGLGPIAHLPAAYLSAGQRRRAALARLLVARRPVWLLDEPLTALDAASQGFVTGIMRAHAAEGGLIIAATHAALDLPASELRLGTPAGAAA